MATVGIVKAVVTADVSKLKKGIDEANSTLTRFSKNMKQVGKSMTMKVTMPLIGLGLAAGKAAKDFEFSMTQIETLVGRSAAEVDQLTESVLGLAGETGRAPKELADAMFFITSAGLPAAAATAALEASAKAAAVGLGETAIVADAVTNAMNGYGMSADGAAFATDVLAKTVEQGKASAADLAPQFGRLIPMAAELGISFDQVGGGLAFLTRASGDAAMSATQLAGVMKSILKPSQQAEETLREVGIDLGDLRRAASRDLLGALQNLRGALEANGREMSDVFEDIRGLNGALQLTGVATDQARVVFDELSQSSGKLDEAFKGVQKTAQFKLSQAMTEFKASMVTLGTAILPVVIPLVRTIADVVASLAEAFGNLSPTVRTITVVLGLLAAAAGPVLIVLGSITSAITTLTAAAGMASVSLSAILGPIGLIAAAGIGLLAFLSYTGGKSREAAERVDELQAEMVEAGTASTVLATDIETLVGQLEALAAASGDAVPAIDALDTNIHLLQGLMDRDLRDAFEAMFGDMEHHNALMQAGTDAYGEFARALGPSGKAIGTIAEAFDRYGHILGEDEDRIRALIDSGELTRGMLREMLMALDATADAHDEVAKRAQDTADAFFSEARNVNAYETALSDVRVAMVDAALAEGDQVRALELVIGFTKSAEARAARLAAQSKATADAVDDGTDALDGYRAAADEARRSTDMFTDASERQRGKVVGMAAELGNLWDIADAFARAREELGRTDLDAAAMEWLTRRLMTVADLESMIVESKQAQTVEVADTVRGVMTLLRLTRQMRMTEKHINTLLDERNELLGEDGALAQHEAFLAALVAEEGNVNDVEQALLDMSGEVGTTGRAMTLLTEEQARANDITGAQAQQLRDLTQQLFLAEGAYLAGHGSVIEFMAAQEQLADAQARIFTGAQDIEDAQRRVNETQEAAEEIDQRLRDAAEELADQQFALNDAQLAVATSGDDARAAAQLLADMFRDTLGPAAGTAQTGLADLVEQANGVFPEFDQLRADMANMQFTLTDEQIDLHVRSVQRMLEEARDGVTGPATSIRDEIDRILTAYRSEVAIDVAQPDVAGVLSAVQSVLDAAALNLQIELGLSTPTVTTPTSVSDQAVYDWLATPEAQRFLGITPFAHGGIVTAPTLGLIGEAGPEAVIPLGQGGMGGGATVNVNVAGSILTESEIGEIVQEQLLRIQARNQTLEFA